MRRTVCSVIFRNFDEIVNISVYRIPRENVRAHTTTSNRFVYFYTMIHLSNSSRAQLSQDFHNVIRISSSLTCKASAKKKMAGRNWDWRKRHIKKAVGRQDWGRLSFCLRNVNASIELNGSEGIELPWKTEHVHDRLNRFVK